MVESYRQRHGSERPSASARLGILLGFVVVAFVVLGLILRALGAGAVLLGLVLFAFGLALGWNARGRREPIQKVATLPTRPPAAEPASEPASEEVSPARAYALQVLELNTPASTQERLAPEVVEMVAGPVAREEHVEILAEPVAREAETTPEVGEPRVETPERKKWSPRAKVETPSSTPESTVALIALETTPLETESSVVPELVTLERKKWTPRSSKSVVLDTLSGSESSSLELGPSSPLHSLVALEASAYPEIELIDVSLPDANVLQSGAPARKKWTPKVKQEDTLLEQAAPLEVPENQIVLEPVGAHTALELTSSARLDSRQILESMGIHLPAQTSSAPPIQMDSSTPTSSETEAVQVSSRRKKWVPRRKA